MFMKTCDRLLMTEMSRKVMAAILAHRAAAPLVSDNHFRGDGTPVKAWALMKSFQPKAEATLPGGTGPGDPRTLDAVTADQPEKTSLRRPATADQPEKTSLRRPA